MKKEEFSLYTFLDYENKNKYQLIQININNEKNTTIKWQIRKNRKILFTFNFADNLNNAKRKFYLITGSEILQTKLYGI